jgi:Dolichyl-phosphate-mannose-protein mannosyltransferase
LVEMAFSVRRLASKEGEQESFVDRPAAPAPVSRRLPWSPIEKVFVLLASALFLVLSIGSMRMESVTTNELLYVPAGLSYLQRLDARMDIEHPPLFKIVAALPVLLLHGKVDYNDPIWTTGHSWTSTEYAFGKKFFESWNANRQTLLFAARLPMVALTLLLGLSLYGMARQFAGPWGGVLTLTLFVTSPFFIANGALVMNDILIALFSLWTMWYFASLWQEPTRRNALLFAGSLAGALLAKFSGVFLFPAIFLCWVWFRFLRQRLAVDEVAAPTPPEGFGRERLAIGAMMLAGVVVFLFYLGIFYRSDPRAILQDVVNEVQWGGGRLIPLMYRSISIMTNHPALERLLLPLWLYVSGLAFVVGHGSRPMYFLGRWHPHGVWYYFPVISFFKLAPGMVVLFFLLAALAASNFLRQRGKSSSSVPDSKRLHLRAMLVTLVVFALIAMASNLNVGVRHFSVPITLAVLLCSLIIPLTRSVLGSKTQSIAFGAIAALAFSCVITAILTYPHYLAYYNVFRLHMPKQEISINANLSLGQSMEELAAFFQEHHVSVSYVDKRASPVDPDVYIPGARVWECDKPDPPTPEWVAVTTVMMIHQPPNCEYLLRYPSWNVGDGAILVFHLTGSGTVP